MKNNSNLSVDKPLIYLLGSLTLLLLLRLIFSIKAPIGLFGYDFGFYLFAGNNPASLFSIQSLSGIFGGFNSPLFLLTHWLSVPAEIALYISYYLASIVLGIVCFAYFWKTPRVGAWAVALLACSVIQIEAYSMFLWKNIFALPLLVLGFLLFERVWMARLAGQSPRLAWWGFGVVTILLLITHRTTGIFYAISVGLEVLYFQVKNKQWRIVLGEMFVLIIALILLWSRVLPVIGDLINNGNYFVRTGLFLNGENKWWLMWPELVLGVCALFYAFKKRVWGMFHTLVLVSVFWIVFSLPFYNRIFIYLDLGLIILAAPMLDRFLPKTRNWRVIFITIFLCVILFRGFSYSIQKNPLISLADVKEIQEFKMEKGVPFVLITSADDAPWVLGNSHGARLGAPGLFEDPHTQQEWEEFWGGKNQSEFLSKYPRPLYFYQRSFQLDGNLATCFIPVSKNFYEYTCR